MYIIYWDFIIFFSIAVKLLALIIIHIWKMTNIKSKIILYSCCLSQIFFFFLRITAFSFQILLPLTYQKLCISVTLCMLEIQQQISASELGTERNGSCNVCAHLTALLIDLNSSLLMSSSTKHLSIPKEKKKSFKQNREIKQASFLVPK